MILPLAVLETITSLDAMDWGAVALATAIIFAILGRKLLRDIKGWLS